MYSFIPGLLSIGLLIQLGLGLTIPIKLTDVQSKAPLNKIPHYLHGNDGSIDPKCIHYESRSLEKREDCTQAGTCSNNGEDQKPKRNR
jgi:hypothetical protein